MPIENPRFADEGSQRGIPRGWTLRSFARSERIVGFGPEPYEGVEGFERWSRLELTLGLVEQVFFDVRPEGFEDFSEGWAVDTFVVSFEDVPAEAALFEGRTVDALERGWLPSDPAWSWNDVQASPAMFAGSTFEDLEHGHMNDGFRWTWESVASWGASFGGAGAERFETPWIEDQVGGGGHHG